ncbi:hypothetical protein [Paenibacillus sp. AR247]|uniref:GltB/FmdC/FwdC-like GXGXG domain-containing protein n=1 Tax=Paenibacillus sp. AR247 TaxID=1631599 RepID=UPI0026CDCCE1
MGKRDVTLAPGMSGGIAYVYDPQGTFIDRCNLEMILLERVEDAEEVQELKSMIEKHVNYTESAVGERVLEDWEHSLGQFVRVIPKDYKRMTQQIRKVQENGLSGEAALLAAFEANMRELARAGNN